MQSFIIILLIWIVILMGSDEFTNIDIDDDDANQSFVEVNSDGLNQVRLTDAIKNNSGIISKEIVKSNKEMTFSKFRTKNVKSSTGQVQERFFVLGSIEIAGLKFHTEFSLTKRQGMRYPILLGRKVLNKRFVIDTSKKYIHINTQNQL